MNVFEKHSALKSALKVASLGSVAALSMVPQHADAQISGTRHNLGGSSATTNNRTSTGTLEICVFCHTPHGSDSSVKADGIPAAPLWNKNLGNLNGGSSATAYTLYQSNTLDAAAITITDGMNGSGSTGPVGSVSLACLSCHDGTQAMDNMINAPGSGVGAGSGTTGMTYSWANGSSAASTPGATGILGGGTVGITTIGRDLSNDHPISIAYCGGGFTTATGASGTCRDKDFHEPQSASFSGTTRFWIDTSYTDTVTVRSAANSGATVVRSVGNTANTRERTDMILYNRATNGSGTVPSVECASCHDPHVESKGDAANPQVSFLRVSQSGSGVCLACHAK